MVIEPQESTCIGKMMLLKESRVSSQVRLFRGHKDKGILREANTICKIVRSLSLWMDQKIKIFMIWSWLYEAHDCHSTHMNMSFIIHLWFGVWNAVLGGRVADTHVQTMATHVTHSRHPV